MQGSWHETDLGEARVTQPVLRPQHGMAHVGSELVVVHAKVAPRPLGPQPGLEVMGTWATDLSAGLFTSNT